MLGDKILFKPHHYKQASDVMFKIEENKNKDKEEVMRLKLS